MLTEASIFSKYLRFCLYFLSVFQTEMTFFTMPLFDVNSKVAGTHRFGRNLPVNLFVIRSKDSVYVASDNESEHKKLCHKLRLVTLKVNQNLDRLVAPLLIIGKDMALRSYSYKLCILKKISDTSACMTERYIIISCVCMHVYLEHPCNVIFLYSHAIFVWSSN